MQSNRLDKEIIEERIIPFYLGMIKDSEQEVRSSALQNLGKFGEVVIHHFNSAEPLKGIVEELKPLLKDSSLYVKDSLIEVFGLHPEIFTEEYREKEIPEIILSLIKDENLKVRLVAIKNLTNFSHLFSVEGFREKILPEFRSLKDEKNWKIRSAMLEQNIQNLKKWKHIDGIWEEYVEILLCLKDDHVFCVRSSLVDTLCEIYDDKTKHIIDKKIFELCEYWSSQKNFIYRVSVAKGISKFANVVGKSSMKGILEKTLDNLSEEKVKSKFITFRFSM